jgi:hypothetical protein
MRRSLLIGACVIGLAGVSFGEEPKPTELPDAEIAKLMVGKWEHTQRFGNVTIQCTEVFKRDGTLERVDDVNGQKINVKATWEIKDGVITTEVVEGPIGKGTIVKGTILSIDDKSQKLEMQLGAQITKTRAK